MVSMLPNTTTANTNDADGSKKCLTKTKLKKKRKNKKTNLREETKTYADEMGRNENNLLDGEATKKKKKHKVADGFTTDNGKNRTMKKRKKREELTKEQSKCKSTETCASLQNGLQDELQNNSEEQVGNVATKYCNAQLSNVERRCEPLPANLGLNTSDQNLEVNDSMLLPKRKKHKMKDVATSKNRQTNTKQLKHKKKLAPSSSSSTSKSISRCENIDSVDKGTDSMNPVETKHVKLKPKKKVSCGNKTADFDRSDFFTDDNIEISVGKKSKKRKLKVSRDVDDVNEENSGSVRKVIKLDSAAANADGEMHESCVENHRSKACLKVGNLTAVKAGVTSNQIPCPQVDDTVEEHAGPNNTKSKSKAKKNKYKKAKKTKIPSRDGDCGVNSQRTDLTCKSVSVNSGLTKAEYTNNECHQNKTIKQNGGAGQWFTAEFDNTARQEKFLRLLGGKKKENSGRMADARTFSSLAMNSAQSRTLANALESQFNASLTFNLKKRAENNKCKGLGFVEDPSRGKTFHIDATQIKSKRFDD